MPFEYKGHIEGIPYYQNTDLIAGSPASIAQAAMGSGQATKAQPDVDPFWETHCADCKAEMPKEQMRMGSWGYHECKDRIACGQRMRGINATH
jgi:hypothetical protein